MYAGELRAVLVGFKHAGHVGFAGELGARMSAPLHEALAVISGASAPLILTVPSRPARERERGYRHVDVLIRAARRRDPVIQAAVLMPRALRTLRGRTTQVGLSIEQRWLNAARIQMRLRYVRRVCGREVVLVDDVVTTGASLAAASRVLTDAGAKVVAVVALCAVERNSERVKLRVDSRNYGLGM